MTAESQACEPIDPKLTGNASQVLELVTRWLAEDDGYDVSVWPVIVQNIEENRLSNRSRFRGQINDTILS